MSLNIVGPNFIMPPGPDTLDAALLRAYNALEHLKIAFESTHYQAACDAYTLAMENAATHPNYTDFTVDARLDDYKENASANNWCLLTGAMAVYQWVQNKENR